MELKIGNIVISKKGFQLIVFAGFVQGLLLGGYLAASQLGKTVPVAILLIAALAALLGCYKMTRKEITIRK
ncbi:hypothetical protein [Pontibacter burrus]|uniref:Uncharacterized protein n=1 Tax=Pontibacter burrus TaxID=2704466 RepID=A0A6B3LJH0_9BACT|nr:hypothetical protein [Pontibacter burrus]NEM96829.1 hypothetical protein [Pontibacter burrus]